VGLAVGFAGVAVVVGPDLRGGQNQALGIAYVLLAALGYAVAALLVRRRLSAIQPLGLTAATMTITTILLAPFVAVAPPRQVPSALAISAIVVLGLLCSAVALILFYRLIGMVGAGRASVINYVTPAVAVALGVLILREPIRPVTLLGFVLVVAGSYLATRRVVSATRPSPTSASLAHSTGGRHDTADR
jgi:drug/metabolite transporter (DMT)-like permease